MEMQTTITISRLSCGGRGSYYTYARFLVMGNGDGDNGDVILILDPAAGSIITDNRAEFRNGDGDGERNTLPGVRDRPLGTTVVGLRASAMENGEGSLPPASRAEYSGACLFANWGKDNGQWSQWMEQRFLGRYTVSFEGRSWL